MHVKQGRTLLLGAISNERPNILTNQHNFESLQVMMTHECLSQVALLPEAPKQLPITFSWPFTDAFFHICRQ